MYLNILKISTHAQVGKQIQIVYDDFRPAFKNFQCLNGPAYSLSEIKITMVVANFCCWTAKV